MSANFILCDFNNWQSFLPLTYTRPVAALRLGILTIAEKWANISGAQISYKTQPYLQTKFPLVVETENFIVNASFLPDNQLYTDIVSLKLNTALVVNDEIVAVKLSDINALAFFEDKDIVIDRIEYATNTLQIKNIWDLFVLNEMAIESDFKLLTYNRQSEPLNETNQSSDKERIFIEKGAVVSYSILNPKQGYIYIGKNAEIMEGCIVRGSLALCDGAVLKMGAKIYGATTIGPFSKIGGEVNNSVIFANSNKGHDGFLGNSVIGEWCNLGANTNNSNLKNNYALVKLWNYSKQSFANTGLQFCGLFMGDHSKSGINTMFNTGTVVGVGTNIFGAGFPRNYIPSFSMGGYQGFVQQPIKQVIDTAAIVMQRRGIQFNTTEKDILEYLFNQIEQKLV